MKAFLKILVVILVLVGASHLWMNWPVRLDVRGTQAGALPNTPATKVKVTILETGYLESPHAMNVRGGSWDKYRSGVMGVVLRHPKGTWLLDAGFGENAQQHFEDVTPAIMQAAASLTVKSGMAAQLKNIGLSPDDLDGILLTHAHWDHVSGLEDMLQVPLLLNAAEEDFIRSGSEHAALAARWVDDLTINQYEYDGPVVEGFGKSHDLMGDGSILLLAMPGHTPGSMAVLVNGVTKKWLFIGDTSWTNEGVAWPAEKPFIAKSMVETDAKQVANWLKQLHVMQLQNPDLQIVPAHDRRSYR